MNSADQILGKAGVTAYPALTGFRLFEDARILDAPWEFGLNSQTPMLLVELECGIERAQGRLGESTFVKTDPTHTVTIMGRGSSLGGYATGKGIHRVFFVSLAPEINRHFPEYSVIDLRTLGNVKESSFHSLCRKIWLSIRARELLLAESLCCELTADLLNRYATCTTRHLPGRLTLSRTQLLFVIEQIEAYGLAKAGAENHVSIQSLAQSTNLSSHHFLAAFKSALGVTPHQFILRKRIQRARELLVKTGMPMLNIAEECGFCTQSHFASTFKATTGQTPLRYRNAIRKAGKRALEE